MTNGNNLIDKNQHVREYLDYYLETDIDLEYAVLLKGNWGSGKTYFIKDYIKDIKSRIENPQNKSEFRKYLDKEILYISLNGVNKLDDIYNLIFESKYVITGRTKFLYNSLKFVSGFNKHSEKFMKQLDVYQFNKKKKKSSCPFHH